MLLIENFRVLSCNHDDLDRYRGHKQIQVILRFQILFTGSFVLISNRSSIKIPAFFATIQVKLSQIKSQKKQKQKKKTKQNKTKQNKTKKISNIISHSSLFIYLFIFITKNMNK